MTHRNTQDPHHTPAQPGTPAQHGTPGEPGSGNGPGNSADNGAGNGTRIRAGRDGDVPVVLAMFDSAVAWLTAQGRTGQWGTRPFTGDAKRTGQVASWLEGGGMRIAEHDGRPAGCISVGPAHTYVTPAAEPELYVQALVIDRRHAGHGVGRALLDWAAGEARARGAGLLRVDCYAGDDGRLVAYYESCGFTRLAPFTVGEWPGMLLQRRL